MKLCALWFALFRGPSANFWLFVLSFVRKGQVARYSTKVRVGNISAVANVRQLGENGISHFLDAAADAGSLS